MTITQENCWPIESHSLSLVWHWLDNTKDDDPKMIAGTTIDLQSMWSQRMQEFNPPQAQHPSQSKCFSSKFDQAATIQSGRYEHADCSYHRQVQFRYGGASAYGYSSSPNHKLTEECVSVHYNLDLNALVDQRTFRLRDSIADGQARHHP